ncbi:MAG: HEAT repeat domain-containing protein [Polyangiaceae bacterium]
MRRTHRFLGLESAVVAFAVFAGAQAWGAPPTNAPKNAGKKTANDIPTVTLSPGLKEKLKSTDPAVVQGALDELRIAGRAGASLAPEVASLLDRGTTLPLSIAALDTLGDVEVEGTSASIAPYTKHRVDRVRRAAVRALAKTKGPAASAALRRSLSDPDAQVRGFAASGLGGIKAHDAIGDLFLALDHRVGEAAASIGQICNAAECIQFSDHLGRQPFDVMTGGFDQILFRPTAEVDDDTKVKIVGKLRELGTKEVNAFLRDVQKRWPPKGSQRVKYAVDQAVAATGGGSSITPDDASKGGSR